MSHWWTKDHISGCILTNALTAEARLQSERPRRSVSRPGVPTTTCALGGRVTSKKMYSDTGDAFQNTACHKRDIPLCVDELDVRLSVLTTREQCQRDPLRQEWAEHASYLSG